MIYNSKNHTVIITEHYYDDDGLLIPKKYHLEDGTELELDGVQYLNATDINGNGGDDGIRFKVKS